jgi:dihydroorotate dehydrogenase (NAD+) catalytic subunit
LSLSVKLAGLELANPLIAASGTYGYGVEVERIADLSSWGGIATKGLYMEPRSGCPTPRVVETPSGLLNAIGLQGIGVRRFAAELLPRLREHDVAVLVNVCGDTVDEYAEVVRVLEDCEGVSALELNISCPNVERGGIAFGSDPAMTSAVVAAVRRVTRRPVIPKLSPNVTDIAPLARAAEEAGADALSCVNTLLGMVVDVETRRPRLAFGTGGLSGPAIRPVAVRLAWQAARAVKLPIIGIGGITCAADALEFLIAGCRAVQIGTASFVEPDIASRIARELGDYLKRHGLSSLDSLIGSLEMPAREVAE